ncbi:cytochrome P450 [Fodinicola feengrottensis]|uniref:Cytochrome P450 n=1 Tax=Fodinicola feengrottensis TaxID=435914 RepID=A0ABN2IKY4_9ACTN|nr:cytochrome P450 [Fodinicola feengrottensis]
MTTTEDLPRLPFAPGANVLDIAPKYRELLADRQVTRVRTYAGDVAWIATRYDDVRTLFDDPRLDRSHREPAKAARVSQSQVLGGPSDNFDTEPRDAQVMRRLLTPAFSARRMNALRPKIGEIITDIMARLEAGPRPADLHANLSFPLPALVICALLGVPYEDRERFRAWSVDMGNMVDAPLAQAAMAEFSGYMLELADRKRVEPGDDVISDLVAAQDEWKLDSSYIGRLSTGLLFAGHETTMTRIDMGTVLLLSNPAQADALRRDPSLLPTAVEEILRVTSTESNGGALVRYAREDIQIGDVTIAAGDAVLLPFGIANRDDTAFDDPDTFDITRKSRVPHLSFGHGPHFCIGASLARIELQEVFSVLLNRFPTLRLAVPVEELQLRKDAITGGLKALPVTW